MPDPDEMIILCPVPVVVPGSSGGARRSGLEREQTRAQQNFEEGKKPQGKHSKFSVKNKKY